VVKPSPPGTEVALLMAEAVKKAGVPDGLFDASRFRLDTYPFGGVGASGFGREGVRYAMEELSQWKFTGMRLTQ
jgi:acyl-CoA reductase-like NAD-dependent aldehyde dehydrogenase